jgi:tRNA-Thr(GGU) m(6)t(6)A37 methyltransferase TsaA
MGRTPMNQLPELKLKIIGTVHNEMKEPGRYEYQHIISEIVLDENMTGSLDNISAFSHVIIFYWYHVDVHPGVKTNKIHPHMDENNPLVGVLATRSPDRPNRIGTSPARILEHKGNMLKVMGCDAIDSSPVLDIKPYNTKLDSVPEATMPEWS